MKPGIVILYAGLLSICMLIISWLLITNNIDKVGIFILALICFLFLGIISSSSDGIL